ncbi:hypothetical protein [Kytococcus sp. Marseille-QA3725]
MRTLVTTGVIAGATLLIARALDRSAKTSELWAAATADLPTQV